MMILPVSVENPQLWEHRWAPFRGNFTHLIGTKSTPSDPSRNFNPNGTNHIQTSTYMWLEGLGPDEVPGNLNGALVAALGSTLPPQGGNISFDVEDNTFDGTVIIQIGEHKFVYGVDFVAGSDVNATAANIRAAIQSKRHLFVADEGGNTITVSSTRPISSLYFKVCHYGTRINIDTVRVAGEAAPGDGTAKAEGFTGHAGMTGTLRFSSTSAVISPVLT